MFSTLPSGPRDPPNMPIQYGEYETPRSPYNTLNEADLPPEIVFALANTSLPEDGSLTANVTRSYIEYLSVKGVGVEYVNEVNGFEDEPNMTEYLSTVAHDVMT